MDHDDREVSRIVTLITGASGSVGSELARQLEGPLAFLVRDKARAPSNGRTFIGDITEPDLALDPSERTWMEHNVTRIIHAAASTRFDLPLEQMRSVNVEGTRHVLDLAKRCERLEAFVHVSTIFVSGTRTGVIAETIEEAPAFVNTYERSKHESEVLALSYADDVPITIHRLSTIIGRTDGTVEHLTAPHHALRIMSLGLASMLPGAPEYPVDLISTEYAAISIIRLLERFERGRIHHIVAGTHRSYTLRELIDASFDHLASADPTWAKREYPKPLLVDRETFDTFVSSVREAENPILLGVVNAVERFAHQLTYPKTFETTNEIDAAHISTYYEAIVRFLVRTRWHV